MPNMPRVMMSDLKSRPSAFDAWINHRLATASPLRHLLALAITFGAPAFAAYRVGFGVVAAALCGLLFIAYVRLYVRAIPAVQRLIDRLRPESDASEKSNLVPGWAVLIHILIGIVLFVILGALEESRTIAPVAMFAAFAAGTSLLHLFWRKRDGTRAFDAFDDQLDDWAAQYRGTLRALGTTLCSLLLPGGVALHAFESGFAERSASAFALPAGPYAIAAACGVAAILFVALTAWLTSSVQRVTADPWKFVRPEPQSTAVPRWVRALHVVIGIAVFIAMAVFGQQHPGGNSISFGEYGLLALLLGWWIGGRGVLRAVWAKLPRGGGYVARN